MTLSPIETGLLVALREAHGRAVAYWRLYEAAWGVEPRDEYAWRASLKVYICRLRRRAGVKVVSERGFGYRMIQG